MAFEWLTKAFSSSAAKNPQDMSFDEARPAFFAAIKKEDCETMSALFKKFPDALDWENEKGTPLYIALAHNKLEAFKHLVSLGADFDKNAPGNSWGLMETAAADNRKDFVMYMLENGVTNIGNAEYWARHRKYFDIADTIKRKDIIRAEYLAKNQPPAHTAPAPQASPDVATDNKIELLAPVQLRKTADAQTP